MGEVKENDSELQSRDKEKKSILLAAITLVIGIFSPVMISIFNMHSSVPDVYIQGMFWLYRQTDSVWVENGFSLMDSYTFMNAFPFLLFRIIPVIQIYKYWL